MQKTKIQFRAMRESLGLTTTNVGEAVGITSASVIQWEQPNKKHHKPSQAGWDYLDTIRQYQAAVISYCVRCYEEEKREECKLAYFRNQAEYDSLKKPFLGIKESKGMPYDVVNAATKAAAIYLLATGACDSVEFIEATELYGN